MMNSVLIILISRIDNDPDVPFKIEGMYLFNYYVLAVDGSFLNAREQKAIFSENKHTQSIDRNPFLSMVILMPNRTVGEKFRINIVWPRWCSTPLWLLYS